MHVEEIGPESQEISRATRILINNFTVGTFKLQTEKSLLCFYKWEAPHITLLIAGVCNEKSSLSGSDKIIKGLQLDLFLHVPSY